MKGPGSGFGGGGAVLRLPAREIVFPRRPLLMGIVNINDDSFCGDGTLDAGEALAQAREMVEAGADMIDVGAESARTNREAISEGEEVRRLLPFLRRWKEVFEGVEPRDEKQVFPPVLSVNTWREGVMASVLPEGVELLNDMGGLPDAGAAKICAKAGCALLVMHTVGLPKQDHSHIGYGDVVGEVREFFREKLRLVCEAGLEIERVVLDPGIGFAKGPCDDLRLLGELEKLGEFGRPLLLPVSRKSVIRSVLGGLEPKERDAGTVACIVAGALGGGGIFRVHNVGAAWATLKVLDGILGGG